MSITHVIAFCLGLVVGAIAILLVLAVAGD